MKTVALIPYYGPHDKAHKACAEELKKLMTLVSCDDCPYVDMARAFLAQVAIEEGADVVVFIDHDIIFNAADVAAMANRLRESHYGVLGALYAYRGGNGLIGRLKNPPREGSLPFFTPGLEDADYLGMGFTAIKVSALEALNDECPLSFCPTVNKEIRPYFMHGIFSDGYHGEDVSFCRRLQAHDIAVGIDREPRIFHKGTYLYGLEDAGIRVPRFQPLDMNFDFGGQR